MSAGSSVPTLPPQENSLPRIAVVGSGAIGLYYGTRLALAGADVRFLMRSDLAHARAHGVSIVLKSKGDPSGRSPAQPATSAPAGASGRLHLQPVQAFARPAEIGPVDLVLVTLKTTANGSLRELLPPLQGPNTLTATLQNGLGNEELLAELVGAERVLGGLCFIASTRTAPGEVTCYHPGSVTLGEFNRPALDRTRALADRFNAAGVKCSAVDNLMEARWRKLVWNIPFNGLSIAAGGITTDRILADPALAREVRALMDEVAGAAARLGYSIPEAFIQKQIDVTLPMGAYQPSSLVDFLAGREVEVEAIWGEPLRRAQAAGAATPRLAALYAKLPALRFHRSDGRIDG